MTADPRARWAAALRVPESASADEALAALLRSLPETEFVPPAERVAAANALAGTAAPVGRDSDVEEALRDEVAAFAARFWSLAPAERLLAWADLSARGASAVRLRELEPGLDVPAAPLTDPAAEELAALVRELFVLPPRARALRRNQWLIERAADADKWRAAHALLRRGAPALAALEPNLEAALAPASTFLAALAEGATDAPVRPVRMSDDVALAGLPDRVRHTAGYTDSGEYTYEAADGRRAGTILRGGCLAIVLMIGGCGLLNRLFVGAGSNSGARRSPPTAWNNNALPPAYTPQPAWNDPPPAPAYPAPAARREFTDADLAEFDVYERLEATGIRGTPPANYANWVAAGRPRPLGARLGQRIAHLTEDQIRTFLAHEAKPGRWPPTHYSDWVRAGRPAKPGPVFVSPPTNP